MAASIRSVSMQVNTPRIDRLCKRPVMGNNRSERLREARQRAGYASATEAAEAEAA